MRLETDPDTAGDRAQPTGTLGPQDTALRMHEAALPLQELGLLQANANSPVLVLIMTAPGMGTEGSRAMTCFQQGFDQLRECSQESERLQTLHVFGFSDLPLQLHHNFGQICIWPACNLLTIFT